MSGLMAVLIAICLLLRKKIPESRFFEHLILQVTWIFASLIIYFAGAVTTIAGPAVLLGFWLFPYTIFNRFHDILGLASFLIIQGITIWVSLSGIISYSPFMSTFPFSEGRPITLYVIFVGGFVLLFIISSIIGSSLIIERLKRRESMLGKMAITDGLTQLYNRICFFEVFQKEISRANRNRKCFSLIIGDVDHFKQVNDSYGHLVEEKALVFIASALKSHLGESDSMARYVGEEFIILLPETEDKKAYPIIERCRKAIASRRFGICPGRYFTLTMSFGVTCFDFTLQLNVENIIKQADEALYKAKNAGRNCIMLL
ncbi:MAG: GGDEF domain-containing protein [Spirochaetales bacterium]|nr:GGDEF domain-containing protein [Spirochaetales bacterium]